MEALSLLAFGADGWGDELLRGAWLTLQLALVTLFFGIVLGLLLAAARLSPWKLVRWPCMGWILVIRGTPEFLVLLLIYFGLDRYLSQILRFLGIAEQFELPRFAGAVIGLAVIFSAYAAEIFRGAWRAVPKGQMEAAVAVGMSPLAGFWRVRMPQMWRFAIPGLGNLWMVLLKDTSLAAVIALNELLRMAKIAGETTRDPLFFFTVAALLYLLMTACSDLVRLWLEKRARRGVRAVAG